MNIYKIKEILYLSKNKDDDFLKKDAYRLSDKVIGSLVNGKNDVLDFSKSPYLKITDEMDCEKEIFRNIYLSEDLDALREKLMRAFFEMSKKYGVTSFKIITIEENNG